MVICLTHHLQPDPNQIHFKMALLSRINLKTNQNRLAGTLISTACFVIFGFGGVLACQNGPKSKIQVVFWSYKTKPLVRVVGEKEEYIYCYPKSEATYSGVHLQKSTFMCDHGSHFKLKSTFCAHFFDKISMQQLKYLQNIFCRLQMRVDLSQKRSITSTKLC